MLNFKKQFLAAVGATLVSPVFAGQVISTAGGVSLGIQNLGALGYYGVGLNLDGVGDAIMPGCLCEGWGASFNGTAGWSANANGGDFNVALVSFTSTASSAESVVNVGSGLQVTQSYGLSASTALIKNHVTLTNLSGASAALRYSRSMDWDIAPTAFNEYVTIGGVGASHLLFSNDNGFATPDPLNNPAPVVAGTNNVNVIDSGPDDHGAYFTFDFGTVGAGQSVSFDIFYGAAGSESAAMSALSTVGAEVYSLGQNSRTAKTDGTPGTFIFGFAGVGGTPVPAVPEPETYAMVLAGLGMIGVLTRRRRA